MNTTASIRAKILFLVTEDWYFWSHRLPMARAARDAGFEVVVATRIDRHGARIEAEGFRTIPLAWRRGMFHPRRTLKEVAEIVAVYRREAPDIVHHVALKPTVFGAFAAWRAGIPGIVNSLNGIAYPFTATGWRAWVEEAALGRALRFLLRRPNSLLIMQNEDDAKIVLDRDCVERGRIVMIRGSGVDVGALTPQPEPPLPVTVGLVARMLKSKGVQVLVEAQQRLRRQGLDIRLLLAGQPDATNINAIPQATLEEWAGLPGITWLGHVEDVREVWAQAHIAVQASLEREGLPKSLLEAAACGRPIVASDTPGCREIARHEHNALLVPPDDVAALAQALRDLADDPERRRRYGAAGRRLAVETFAADLIGRQTVAVYERLLAGSHGQADPRRARRSAPRSPAGRSAP